MREDHQRLDKWLWYARIVKTRTLAAKLVSDGHVRVNGTRITQAAKAVGSGDVLTIALSHATIVIEVVAAGNRRGPAREARELYIEHSTGNVELVRDDSKR